MGREGRYAREVREGKKNNKRKGIHAKKVREGKSNGKSREERVRKGGYAS